MIVLPAIDIRGGNAVRLYKGDYSKEEIVAESIIETAKKFEYLGAEYIHLVDLDGAKFGVPSNHEKIIEVAKIVNIPVEVGGGIRDIETIDKLLSNGVSRVILGTVAIKNKFLLKKAISKHGEKIAVGVDCNNGYLCANGWLEKSDYSYIEFCKELEKIGVKTIIVTDIAKDGTLEGANLDMIKQLQKKIKINIIASGGVRDIDDIKNLKKLNVYGVITGKAIYSKNLDIIEAIKISK